MKINKCFFLSTIPFGFFLLVMMISAGVQAQSLWVDNQQSRTTGFFTDRSARNVGDIITIIINENTTSTTSGNTQNSKSSNVDLGVGTGWFDFLSKATGGKYNDGFKAQGSSSNSNRVQGRVTVTVTEIKPGGILAVSGTQTIKQNKEEQKITITGLVRQEDVANDNTVLSSNVANAQIKVESNGPIGKKQRQGILSQIFNFIF